MNSPEKTEKIQLSELSLAYIRKGEGKPIILLHGNGETHMIFDKLIPLLAEKHTVFALDSRCHGESGVGELSYSVMAKDVAEFICAKGLSKPDIIGFSDGGIVALLLAISSPDLVGKIVACGANTTPKGLSRGVRFLYSLAYGLYKDKKIGLMLKEPHITTEQLNSITSEVLITAGEKDIITQKETEYIHANIRGSHLVIFPSCSHTSYIVHTDMLYAQASAFLDKE